MEQMLQIAIGIVPALVLLVVLIFAVRRDYIPKVVTLALLAVIACGSVIWHFAARPEPEQTAEVSQEDVGSGLNLVYALLDSDDYAGAEELLNELFRETVYQPEYSLCKARLYAASGNYPAANVLYEKAIAEGIGTETVESEKNLVSLCLAGMKVDQALIDPNNDSASDANMQDIRSKAEAAKKELFTALESAVKSYTDQFSEKTLSGITAMNGVDSLYTKFMHGEIVDEEEVKAILKQLSDMKREDSSLFSQSTVRLAQVKLQLMLGNYKAIAKSADECSDYRELMVIAELYQNDHISKKDFAESFASANLDKYKAVLKQLEMVYREYFINQSAAIRKPVKAYIDDLQQFAENPGMVKLQEMLEKHAEKSYATDRSKIYLQLSNLAFDRGNTVSADDYLTRAMNSVDICTDMKYTNSMFSIIDIINDKENTESLKNINQYVEAVLDNSTVIPMSDSARNPKPEENADRSETAEDGTVKDASQKDEAEKVDYSTHFSDYISKKRTAIHINKVDASNFSEVVLEVSVDSEIAISADRLKSLLKLTDCGADIQDFKVEDISVEKTNIILVCDVSGSMSDDAMKHLKEAVSLFVKDKTDKERIGLVTFSSSIENVYGLDSSVEELNAAVAQMQAFGGTDMYSAVLHAVSMLEAEENAKNIIILMSDGEDNSPKPDEMIHDNVGAPCSSKGIVLYSVGLGNNVNSVYLDTFASGTGGSYLYVNDSQTLVTFYEFLHNLIVNRYRITYKATDTFTNNRTVQLNINTDTLSYDVAHYSLSGEDVHSQDLGDKSIQGLDTKLLYKSGADQTIKLNCSGFSKDDRVSIVLKDKLEYTIPCKFVNEGCYELTIPSNIALGEYNMTVEVNGYQAFFENELVIADTDFSTVYGPYSFVSCIRREEQDSVYLSGYVCMNGWMHFNGCVELTGNLDEDVSVKMTDKHGSYIQYSKSNAKGLAKHLANKNINLPLPALGTFNLFNDYNHSAESDDYRVDKIPVASVYVANAFELATPGLMLYPNRIKLEFNAFSTKFPFQDDLLKECDLVNKAFSFKWSGSAVLTNMSVGLCAEFSSKSDSGNYKQFNIGAMPVYLNPAEFKVKIDTLSNEYYIKYLTRVAFLPADGMGFSIKWSGALVPKEVRLYCDYDLKTNFSGVPVTFSDFELALTDIDINVSVWNWAMEGKTKISVAKISSVLPKLEKYLGDVCVASMDETTLKFSFGQAYIKVATTLKLFDKVQMGSVTIEAGRIPYENLLLGMTSTKVNGLHVALSKGIVWDSDNCDINMTGNVDTVISDKYVGVQVQGICNVEVEWWILSKEVDINGVGLIGIYEDRNGDMIFTVRARSNDGNTNKGINIMWSKKHGMDVDTKFF